MDIKFKGHCHPMQGLPLDKTHPCPKPGADVMYNDEVIGTVDSVGVDDVLVKLKPGCEGKFLELINTPTYVVGIGNLDCKPGVTP